jgi:cell division protein ZapA (FtsZ GTPase activity inhibitor)
MATIETYILGHKYTISGDAPEAHIEHLVAFVNSRIQDVYRSSPNIAPLKASILASITIADELLKLREEQEDIAKNIEEKTAQLSSLFE